MRRSVALTLSLLVAIPAVGQIGPTGEFKYPYSILPDSAYDTSIPTPESILGFAVGDRAAFPEEIVRVFQAMADASPRAEIVEYARTHEGRPAIHVIISSERNMARRDQIKADLARIADPRGLSESDAEALLSDLPAPAWLGYSIHGNETSGSDAAMLVAYHLIASLSDEVARWRDEMLILIDPMQNPDGRNRWLTQIQHHRAVSPNIDDQSLLHSGYWPWGRGNHYYFDLNRDWILGVHPESRGRILAARPWHPLLFVDAHEMGSQNTYMFSPDAEPLNLHFPAYLEDWQEKFGRDQAAAFDKRGWRYWNGFPFDNWYPGYSSSWGKIIGAVAILYEQASFDEDGIRRPEGTVITYHEAVHHHAASSWSNLETLFENRDALKKGFLEDRRQLVSTSGPYANRSWIVLPTENNTRLDAFLDRLELQGIEYGVASSSFTARSGRDMLGRSFERREIPAGSIVISNRQPAARAAATLLNFDERLSDEVVARERKNLLEKGRSLMYDVTSWNLLMLHGLEGLELDQDLTSVSAPYQRASAATEMALSRSPVGYAVNNDDDATVAFAARLLERGVQVRVATKDSQIDGETLARGSVVILNSDNRTPSEDGFVFSEPRDADVRDRITTMAAELGLQVRSLGTMQSPGELPDLGNVDYRLLQQPQIALVGRGSISTYDYGSIWHAIDQELGIRHSHLDAERLTSEDLRRYNVIVLPDRSGSWSEKEREVLTSWVREGGTLVATGRSAHDLSKKDSKLSAVRHLRDVVGDLDTYETDLLREWHVSHPSMPDGGDVWSHTTPEHSVPWDTTFDRPDSTELARLDRWRRIFMPQSGSMLAARTNTTHWLTFGTDDYLSVLFEGSTLLMSGSGVETAVRIGVFSEGNGPARVGWSAMPDGYRLHVRQSGLVWPEAVQRMANAALVTREQMGRGQVILIGFAPNYRGSTVEARQILLNAIVLGPGMGARAVVEP